jgi:peptidoglycan/LPS O-acetylase OafA/YrhL
LPNYANRRLVEIDALRGVAALSVVLFHYSTRFTEVFGGHPPPTLSFNDGHYGVNLFFIISGFVIFMTLEKTSRPMDFVVSRFSRLFPTYWVAVILTYSVTHFLGLPDKLVSLASGLGNLMMIHNLFQIPHVDGVYWTLEVELLFYFGMFVLYRMRALDQIHFALISLLALRVIYFALEKWFNIELPWTISRLLILKYIPWFSLGISVHIATSRRDRRARQRSALTAACAILALLIVDSLFLATLAVILSMVVLLAAIGKARILAHPILVWLGAISYPLYLIHENIGWSIQLRLHALGIPTDAIILVVVVISLTMASVLTRYVEQPAMRWIRSNYVRRQAISQ